MPQQAPTKIIVDPMLVERADIHCPTYMPRTVFLNVLIEEGLDKRARLDGATEPASGQDTLGRSPSISKAVNKTANKERARVSSKTTPENLYAHQDLIQAFWKVKGGGKSDASWKLLMTELTKIQDAHGDAALRGQLELAEANRWKGVTLANFERYGLSRGNAPAQGYSKPVGIIPTPPLSDAMQEWIKS